MISRVVAAVLPALNEAETVTEVVDGFRAEEVRVVVVDNGSRDDTAQRAVRAGAEVVTEARRGYGAACLAGINYLQRTAPPDVAVFGDCDGSLDPRDLPALLRPVVDGDADLALGWRRPAGPGAWMPQQQFGNAVVVRWVRALHGLDLHDLSSFRAVSWPLLQRLDLENATFAFPLETILRAFQEHARIVEVPVRLRRRRAGRSKVAGSPLGTLRAAAGLMLLGLKLRIA